MPKLAKKRTFLTIFHEKSELFIEKSEHPFEKMKLVSKKTQHFISSFAKFLTKNEAVVQKNAARSEKYFTKNMQHRLKNKITSLCSLQKIKTSNKNKNQTTSFAYLRPCLRPHASLALLATLGLQQALIKGYYAAVLLPSCAVLYYNQAAILWPMTKGSYAAMA